MTNDNCGDKPHQLKRDPRDDTVPSTVPHEEHCPACNDSEEMCEECPAWLSPNEYRLRLLSKRVDLSEFSGPMKPIDVPKPGLNTVGQRRVGLNFNPSQSVDVHMMKSRTAISIDEMLALNTRAGNIAATALEDACMWAVKALTNPEEDG